MDLYQREFYQLASRQSPEGKEFSLTHLTRVQLGCAVVQRHKNSH